MKQRQRPLILIVQAALIVGWQSGYATSDADGAVSASRRGADWDTIRARAMSWLRAQASATHDDTRAKAPAAPHAAVPQPMARPDVAPVNETPAPQPAEVGLVPLRPEPAPETTMRIPIPHGEDQLTDLKALGQQDELVRTTPAPRLPEPAPVTRTDSDLPTLPTLPREEYSADFGAGTKIASADLDYLRGGFVAPNGQQFHFGITRTVYVNGALIATQTINLVNAALASNPVTAPAVAAPVAAPVAPTPVAAPPVVTPPVSSATPPSSAPGSSQNGTPSTASTTSTTSSTTPSTTTSSAGSGSTSSVVASPASNVSVTHGASSATSQATAVVVTPTAGSVAIPAMVVQNGITGNMADLSGISQSVSPLILQNTLNGQSIRTETTINATVPSLSIMESINQMRAINEAIRNAVTSR